MGMYVTRNPLVDTRDLNQGDILIDILRPKTATARNFTLRRDGAKLKYPAPPETLALLDPTLRVMTEVERSDAIVISNSCDNAIGNHVVFAPIRPWKLADDPPEGQWYQISQAATGTANPKFFYLPAAPEFDRSERFEAQLHLVFSVSQDFIERCVEEAGTRRLCGLTPEALQRLQWQLGLVFSRNAREDYDWPSNDDLKLKLEYLNHHIKVGHARKAMYVEERRRVEKLLGMEASSDSPDAVASGEPPVNELGGSVESKDT